MSIFTRRHYVWLASVARDQLHGLASKPLELSAVEESIEILTNALQAESVRGFDRERFLHNIYAPLEVSVPTPSNTFRAAGPPQGGEYSVGPPQPGKSDLPA